MTDFKRKVVEIHVPVTFLTVDCGKCGSIEYHLKVLPQENETKDGHRAKLYAVQCAGCQNVLNLDDQRFLKGKGESSYSPLIKPLGVG